MTGPLAWFTRNTVAANLLMALVLALGVAALPSVVLEIFPEVSSEIITVAIPYPGATPSETEESLCIRVEEQVQDVDGVDRITSSASEGACTVNISLLRGTDLSTALDSVKTRVDAIDTFPEDAEQPIVQELILRQQVINVAVSGEIGERALKEVGQRVRDDIAALPGITYAILANARPYEISIEVSETTLRRHGLTFDSVADAVRRSSLDLPGGSVRTEGGEILLRATGQAYRGEEFESIVLLTRPDGTRLKLGDVAHVDDGFAETDQSSSFDGDPAVVVQVYRVGDQNALEIAAAVREYVERRQAELPSAVKLTVWADFGLLLDARLSLLLDNGLTGFILVFLVLALFLRPRLAVWTSLGIPISFLGAIALLPSFDISINMLSLFAFILVLGIVVDDAIVVAENIHARQQGCEDEQKAAIIGVREVGRPVIFAVLTTMAAFMPLLTVSGPTGKLLAVIPAIVMSTLVFSLVESLLILPAHLSHRTNLYLVAVTLSGLGVLLWLIAPDAARRLLPALVVMAAVTASFPLVERLQRRFAAGLAWTVQNLYRPFLERALEWRYLTISIAIASLILTLGLMVSGIVQFIYFPKVEADNVAAMLTMPQGTPADVTDRTVARIEAAARAVDAEIQAETGESAFLHILRTVGGHPFRQQQDQNAGASFTTSGGHLGEVNIELVPSESRPIGSEEIARRWREKVGIIPDAVELAFSASLFNTSEAFNVELNIEDMDDLVAAAEALERQLATYPGVFDIANTFRAGKREIEVKIRPDAELLGLTQLDLARQVRQAFYGEEVQRIQRGRDDIRVMVRYPADRRASLADIDELRIRTPDGHEVEFAEVAEATYGRGFASILRADRRRAVNVTADVDTSQNDAGSIIAHLESDYLPKLSKDYPGLSYSFRGQQREQADSLDGMFRGGGVALLMIYALLAVPFRSYLQPLIVMTAIPFGLVGAIWGHVFLGLEVNILSGFGLVALAGVVVNDSLVLVDFVNRRRDQGGPILEAVRDAASGRFRPILLTSLTTFVGLYPLLTEKSLQAQFLIPMAVSLAYGVLFSTLITLVLVPTSYLILDDVSRLFLRLEDRLFRRPEPRPDPALADDEPDGTSDGAHAEA